MSDYRKPSLTYLAPGASGAARVEFPAARDSGGRRAYHDPVSGDSSFPGMHGPGTLHPDDHVVEPETGQEMIDGAIVQVMPSESAHADRQFDINYVLRGNIAAGYRGATELLTRVAEGEDFATDACIRKEGRDAEGHRYLEEISFEVKHTQSEASLTRRARELIHRGVRRVFAIYVTLEAGVVRAGPVKEWSADRDEWFTLDPDGVIEDRCLRNPIEVRAFIDAFEADNAVARALVAQQNPVIVEVQTRSYDAGKSEGYDAGKSEGECSGLREGIQAMCQGFGVELTTERAARLDSLGAQDLRSLLRHLQERRSWQRSVSRNERAHGR